MIQREEKIRMAARFFCPIKCETAEMLKYVLRSLRRLGFHWASGDALNNKNNLAKWLIKSLEEGCNSIYLTPKDNRMVCWATAPDHPNGAFI